jgi:chromosome segregation ATPase
MSFAKALNEAKQVIVQQQYRIKADAEKIKTQQQQIIDQSAVMIDNERKLKEQAAEIRRLSDELESAQQRLADVTTAREQAEAQVDRQGQQITTMQAAAVEFERTIAGQAERIASLADERDSLLEQLPTKEDEDALSALADLLNRRPSSQKRLAAGAPAGGSSGTIRLAQVVSESESGEQQAQAA